MGEKQMIHKLLVFLLTFSIILSVSADKVFLKNGKVLEGTIIADTGKAITIDTGMSKFTLSHSMISKTEKGEFKNEKKTTVVEEAREERIYEELCWQADSFRTQGKLEDAVKEFKKALDNPDSAQAIELINRNLSDTLTDLALQQYDYMEINKAEKSAKEAITCDPTNLDAKDVLIDIYCDSDKKLKAIPLLASIVEQDCEDFDARLMLAECYCESQKYEEAYSLLKKDIEGEYTNDSDLRDIWRELNYQRYQKYNKESNYDKALSAYEEYFNNTLKNKKIYIECAEVYKKAGRFAKYQEYLNVAQNYAVVDETKSSKAKINITVHAGKRKVEKRSGGLRGRRSKSKSGRSAGSSGGGSGGGNPPRKGG